MEGIDTALTVWCEFIDTLRDPAGAVTGDNLYTGQMFIGKSLVELLQDRFSMTVANPYNSVGIDPQTCLLVDLVDDTSILLQSKFAQVNQYLRVKGRCIPHRGSEQPYTQF